MTGFKYNRTIWPPNCDLNVRRVQQIITWTLIMVDELSLSFLLAANPCVRWRWWRWSRAGISCDFEWKTETKIVEVIQDWHFFQRKKVLCKKSIIPLSTEFDSSLAVVLVFTSFQFPVWKISHVNSHILTCRKLDKLENKEQEKKKHKSKKKRKHSESGDESESRSKRKKKKQESSENEVSEDGHCTRRTKSSEKVKKRDEKDKRNSRTDSHRYDRPHNRRWRRSQNKQPYMYINRICIYTHVNTIAVILGKSASGP